MRNAMLIGVYFFCIVFSYNFFLVIESAERLHVWGNFCVFSVMVIFVYLLVKKKFFISFVYLLAGSLFVLSVPFLTPGYTVSTSVSNSNLPSIVPGDFVVSRKNNIRYTSGEMVVFRKGQNKFLRKRIHGVPGDEIFICNEIVYVNGFFYSCKNNWQPQPFNKNTYCSTSSRRILGKNEFFLLGDNLDGSRDSRYFGPVDKDSITEVVLYSVSGDDFFSMGEVRYFNQVFVTGRGFKL